MSNRVEQRGDTVDQEMSRMLIPWLPLAPWMTPPWIPLLCQKVMLTVTSVLATHPLAMLAEAKTYISEIVHEFGNCGLS